MAVTYQCDQCGAKCRNSFVHTLMVGENFMFTVNTSPRLMCGACIVSIFHQLSRADMEANAQGYIHASVGKAEPFNAQAGCPMRDSLSCTRLAQCGPAGACLDKQSTYNAPLGAGTCKVRPEGCLYPALCGPRQDCTLDRILRKEREARTADTRDAEIEPVQGQQSTLYTGGDLAAQGATGTRAFAATVRERIAVDPAFAQALVDEQCAEIERLRSDPWRIPIEQLPEGWEFDGLDYSPACDVGKQFWCCLSRKERNRSIGRYSATPSAAFLAAVAEAEKA